RPRRWTMGSVADAVVRTVACPVLMMRGEAAHATRPIERALLALDGSSASELLPAAALSEAFGAVLDLVLVLSPCAGLYQAGRGAVLPRWASERLKCVAVSYLQQLASRAPAVLTVERHVLHGPAAELLYYAECSGADLIVMGSGGLSTELVCSGRLAVLLL